MVHADGVGHDKCLILHTCGRPPLDTITNILTLSAQRDRPYMLRGSLPGFRLGAVSRGVAHAVGALPCPVYLDFILQLIC